MEKKKPKTRSNGEGTIFKTKRGWRGEITVGWKPDGKRSRRSVSRKRRADVVAELDQIKSAASQGLVEPSTLTVGQFLERWINDTVKPNRAPNTYVSYRRQVVNHITPRIGSLKLSKLAPMHVVRFTASMVEDAVGGCTRRYAFRVLNNAMNHARKHGLIASNPCTIADSPTHKRADIFPFTIEEVNRILSEVKGDRYEAMYVMAFTTGMRPSELYGLHWADVDFSAGTIFVRLQLCRAPRHKAEFRPPKTKSSIRTIHMPKRLIDALRDRRRIQMAEGTGGSPLVLCTHKGKPLWNSIIYRDHWEPLLKRLDLEHRGMHHMRHTYATLQLRAGVPVHIVSAVLGHSKPSQTWDTYSHLMPGDEKTATNSIQGMIG